MMRLKSNAKSGEPAALGTVFNCMPDEKSEFCIYRINHCDGWHLDCKALSIEDKKLKCADLFDAVHESVEIMRNELKKLNKQFDEAFSAENIETIEIRNY